MKLKRFLDPMHISKLDHRFDYFEERWITLGTSTKDKILVVANMFFDENGEEVIRIMKRGLVICDLLQSNET